MVTSVDSLTLRCTIVELKDLKGLSFQKIADYIQSEYGIVRTRQAIAKMYKTAKTDEKEKAEHQRLVCHAINIYCLLDSALDTLARLQEWGIDVTYRQLLDIIKSNQNYIDCVEHTIIANIKTMIDKCKTPDVIRDALEYKGIKLSDKRFSQYFEEAYSVHIKDTVLKIINKYNNITHDSKKAMGIGERFNLNIKTGEFIDRQ